MTLGRVLIKLTVALAFAGCGILAGNPPDDDDDEDENQPSTIAGAGSPGKVSVDASSMRDLNLSAALQADLPDALDSQKPVGSLRLVAGKRSSEACQIGKVTVDALARLGEVMLTLCHLEVESASIRFGVKYGGTTGIWVDNSQADRLTVSVCHSGKLQQKFVVTGASAGSARGAMQSFLEWPADGGTSSIALSAAFDRRLTEAGRQRIAMKLLYRELDLSTYASYVRLDLKDDNAAQPDRIEFSQTFKSATTESAIAQVAAVNAAFGQMYRASGGGRYVDDSGTSQIVNPSVTVATFDAAGLEVEANASPDFAAGGALSLAVTDVPKLLPAAFVPEGFSQGSWDCQGDETLTFSTADDTDKEGRSHAKCEAARLHSYSGPNCHADDASYGTTIQGSTFVPEISDVTEANRPAQESDL